MTFTTSQERQKLDGNIIKKKYFVRDRRLYISFFGFIMVEWCRFARRRRRRRSRPRRHRCFGRRVALL